LGIGENQVKQYMQEIGLLTKVNAPLI